MSSHGGLSIQLAELDALSVRSHARGLELVLQHGHARAERVVHVRRACRGRLRGGARARAEEGVGAGLAHGERWEGSGGGHGWGRGVSEGIVRSRVRGDGSCDRAWFPIG